MTIRSQLRRAAAALAICWSGIAATSHADLIGHWRFDEEAGATTAADEVGSNPGTINGAVTTGVTGIAGNAYEFNPAAEGTGFVDMGDASFIADILEAGGANLNTFSFSAWLKFTASHNGQVVYIGNDGSNEQYIAYGPQADRFRSWHRGGGGAQLPNLGPVINDDEWHHVALTVSPTEMKTYINGVVVNTQTHNYGTINAANSLEVGRLGRLAATDYLRCQIDDVQIYNATLPEEAVLFLRDNAGETYALLDSDGDGLPDAWEIAHGLDPNDDGTVGESSPGAKDGPNGALGDPDGDGLTNLQEFDPTQGPNPLSPPTHPNLADTDGDGLSDLAENNTGVWTDATATGTDPTDPDSDGDGLSDGMENPDTAYVAGVNPGTDPNTPDSDGDGFADGYEFNTSGTNPTDADDFPAPPPLIASEDFTYPDGPLTGRNGGTGWTGPWEGGTGALDVLSGEAVGAQASTNNQAFRSFPPVANGRLYIAFRGEIPNITPDTGTGLIVAGASLNSDSTEWSFLGFRADFFRLDGASSGDVNDRNTAAGTSVANTRTAFVLEVILDPAPGAPETFNAWIFPDNVLPQALPETPDMTTSYNIGDGVALNRIRIFDNQNVVAKWDDLIIASTYAVVPKSGELAITDITVTPPDEVSITFNSIAGNLYDIEQSLALTSFESIGEIVATGPTTTFTRSGVALETREFFRVGDLGEAPPLFSEDFEADNGGFTVLNMSAGGSGSDWAYGAPFSIGVADNLVDSGNGGSVSAFGTDISDPGYVTTDTETYLRSPVIDLTGVDSASLRFAEALDFEGNDLAEVWIIEADSDTSIGDGPIHTSADDDITGSEWADVGPIAIPAAALGRQVRFEWRFTKVDNGTNYLGWFIDDVEITRP